MSTICIVLFAATMLYMSITTRLDTYIKALSVQGLMLFLLVVFDKGALRWDQMLLYIETLGLKTIAIPMFLMYTIRRNNIVREIEPYISQFYFIVISSCFLLMGFFIAIWSMSFADTINKALFFGISVTAIIEGYFIIMTRKKIITHVIGFIIIENGIFLLSLATLSEMSFMVSIGLLLDIFLAVFLFGIFVNRIQSEFDEVHIDTLSNLKD